jgi:tetratricopeptide (TPR) repeat protein
VAVAVTGEVAAVTTTPTPTTTTKDERHELALKVHALVSQAAERVRARDMRGSEELLTRALELDPQNGDALARRAFARAVLEDLPGALADADRAIELAPESGLAHQARATVAVVGGDYDRAEVELSRSLELDPRDGDLWVERAQVRGAQQLYGRALEDLRHAVDLPLRAYTVAHLRGLMARFLWADGRREQAMEEVERALALDPDTSVALEVRAASRLDRQDARGALEDAHRADAIAESHESASVLGLARAALGDVRARSDLQRAVRLARDPTQRANAAGALGQVSQHIYTQLNALAVRDTAAAVVEADRVLEADPSFELLRHLRGRLRAFTGDLPGARADFDRIVADGGPGVVSALLERALVHVGLGDVRAALADADRALALNPDEAGAWRIRGRVRGEADDHAGALADLDRALALRDEPASRLWRGALRVGAGDAEGALDDLARAEEGRPLPADLAAVRLFRCMALLALGRLADARAESEQAVREAPPGAPDVWSMHSEVLLHLRRTEEAVAAADRAVELAPDDAVHRLRRATAHLVAHDLPRARADLDLGLRRSGEGFVAKKLRALERRVDAFVDSSAALKRRDELAARAIMDALVEGAPDDVATRVMHAHFLIAIGDRVAARQAAERAMTLAPHDLHARAVRAELLPPEQGLDDLAFILAVSPGDLELLVRRAALLGRLGREQEARADLDRAAAAPASRPYALLFRARARLQVGDVGGARADLDASLAQDDLPQTRLERAHLTRFYAPDVAVDDLERLARVVRTGPTFEASQRELAHARRALEGGEAAPCDWPHLHPVTTPR